MVHQIKNKNGSLLKVQFPSKLSKYLWQLIFPRTRPKENREFAEYAQSDGYSIHFLFKIPGRVRGIKKVISEFNQDQESESNQGKKKQLFNIAEAATKAEIGRGSTPFKGFFPLESMIKKSEMTYGIKEAQELFDDRVIIALDPGMRWLARGVASLGKIKPTDNNQGWKYDAEFKKVGRSGHSFYLHSGVDDHILKAHQDYQSLKTSQERLSQSHTRVWDSKTYKKNAKDTQEDRQKFIDKSMEPSRSKQAQILRSKKQRYWATFVNDLVAMVDHLHEIHKIPKKKQPVIIFGDAHFKSIKRSRSGNPRWLKEYLARYFMLIPMNEFCTSQKCPKCWGQLEKEGKGVRVKRCKHCKQERTIPKKSGNSQESNKIVKDFIVNRDLGAAVNMIAIAVNLMAQGQRPGPFSPKNTDRNNDETKSLKVLNRSRVKVRIILIKSQN